MFLRQKRRITAKGVNSAHIPRACGITFCMRMTGLRTAWCMVKDFCKENRKSVISFCALFALGIVLGIFITINAAGGEFEQIARAGRKFFARYRLCACPGDGAQCRRCALSFPPSFACGKIHLPRQRNENDEAQSRYRPLKAKTTTNYLRDLLHGSPCPGEGSPRQNSPPDCFASPPALL